MTDPQHLLDLIREVRPRAALFTTYTFSVGHFDSVFVPVLRSVGCQDIAVLVDADEAARCSQESASRAAGRVYRIAPVIAPGGGVFHPKLAYLVAEAGDVLAVASGNLTASGQSLQLESFDAVFAQAAPTVFRELADWMAALASLIKQTSPQASGLLEQMVPRSRQAHRRHASNFTGPAAEPSLIHTLGGTAREALEAAFIAQADGAESVVVLSPFHSPDGGPVLRLATSVEAKSLAIGLDGSKAKLTAPFERGRFKPELSGRFVLPETQRASRRLHAKVFELHAKDKVLVMTGSVNATAQSFESSMNVEVSLARWLAKSPFTWRDAKPLEYGVTQNGSEFLPSQPLYVDAWLDEDRVLHGSLTARKPTKPPLKLTIHHGDEDVFTCEVTPDEGGQFEAGPIPASDIARAMLLTVSDGQDSAYCWLNVYEELNIAFEERERRAAVARVLRGEYAAEDIAEVVRLLTTATQGIVEGTTATLRRPADEAKTEADTPFSFQRWERSGRHRDSNTLLGRNPYELLKVLNRWMNADLNLQAANQDLAVPPSAGLKNQVQLQSASSNGDISGAQGLAPNALLDHLCQTIPVALERQPELEYGAVLAEIVASRAVDRALKQDLVMAPCLSWLDRFSRFTFPESARGVVNGVAAAMACLTAHRLAAQGQDAQLSVLREAVERFAGCVLSAERWRELSAAGLERDLFRRVGEQERAAVLAVSEQLSAIQTLDDSLLSLLRKAFVLPRNAISNEPEAATFADLAASLRERKPRRQDLLRGLMTPAALDREGAGCPFCYRELSKQDVATMKRKHALVHKGFACGRILLLTATDGRLQAGITELPDA
jgi:hypothetical protein